MTLLEGAAEPVLDLRRKQAAWDKGEAAAKALGVLGRIDALRKLGPRPTLNLH